MRTFRLINLTNFCIYALLCHDLTKKEHCMELVKRWHEIRLDLENSMYAATQDKTILRGILGKYKKDIFRGHCSGEGGSNYTRIQGQPETFQNMQAIYRSGGHR
jgi:hypothetical protein